MGPVVLLKIMFMIHKNVHLYGKYEMNIFFKILFYRL